MPILAEFQNRREFLRTCARNLSLAGLALFGGAMLTRKHDDRAKHLCINEFICSGCGVFSDCILPQAMSAKAKNAQQR